MAEIGWTVERALEAQAEFERTGGTVRGPLWQWATLHELEKLAQQFAAGDKGAVFHAIYLCTCDDLVAPEWAAKAFRRGYQKVLGCRVASWDEAFGSPFPDGTKVTLARRRRELRPKVFVRIMEIINREAAPVDETLFQRVADELKIGKRQCKQFWYDMGGLPRWPVEKYFPPKSQN